jgi:hypothetical protein
MNIEEITGDILNDLYRVLNQLDDERIPKGNIRLEIRSIIDKMKELDSLVGMPEQF